MTRNSLQFSLAWRLAALLSAAAAAAIFGLVFHARKGETIAGGNGLVHKVLAEFFFDIAWVIPVAIAASLAVGVWALRRGLRPLITASSKAAALVPGRQPTSLSSSDIPDEIRPLVDAFDEALVRHHDAYEAQKRFTANAAHELRTPLAVLKAGLERLPPSPEVHSLREDADRLTRVVSQLLALARVEAATGDSTETIDLAGVVRDVAARLAPDAHARNVGLGIDTAPKLAACTLGREEAEAIVRNLLENAIAHAPAGSEVSISVDAPCRLSIVDRGPGIRLEDRSRVFERFWRGGANPGGGSGLGLAIVKEVADRCGGRTWVQDTIGGGATFVFEVPVEQSN